MLDFFADCLLTTGKVMVGITISAILLTIAAAISYWFNNTNERFPWLW